MGALMISRNPEVARAFIARFGIDYKPDEYLYRFRRLWDTQAIGAAATSSPAVEFFNTATSSRSAHARGVAGSNLWHVGRIPGGSIMVVTAIEAQFINGAAPTAALVRDAAYYADSGVIEGLFLNGKQVTEEVPLSDALLRAGAEYVGMDGVTAVGSGLAFGARGVTDGEQFSPETLPIITSDDVFKVPVFHNGPVAPTAAMTLRVRLSGLIATRR